MYTTPNSSVCGKETDIDILIKTDIAQLQLLKINSTLSLSSFPFSLFALSFKVSPTGSPPPPPPPKYCTHPGMGHVPGSVRSDHTWCNNRPDTAPGVYEIRKMEIKETHKNHCNMFNIISLFMLPQIAFVMSAMMCLTQKM